LLLAAGKAGLIYELDRDNLGQFNKQNDSRAVQVVKGGTGSFGAPAYWNGHVYYLLSGDVLRDYRLENGRLSDEPVAKSGVQFTDPGATPAVSANGTKNGIVWVISQKTVYLGTKKHLEVYGLLPTEKNSHKASKRNKRSRSKDRPLQVWRILVVHQLGQESFAGLVGWLEIEEFGEVADQLGLGLGEGDGTVEKFFQGSGLAVGQAAGDDEVEIAEISGDIVGKAVGSDPAADMDADGSEFFFGGVGRDPDAGFARNTIGGDAEAGGGADHDFFKGANVPVHVSLDARQIENGVADDLAGAVISDVSTAIGFVKLDIFLMENAGGGQEIFAFAVAAERDDRRVLAEEEDVFDSVRFAGGGDAGLQGEGVGEAD
jgi:hypothetical protein